MNIDEIYELAPYLIVFFVGIYILGTLSKVPIFGKDGNTGRFIIFSSAGFFYLLTSYLIYEILT